MRTVLYFASDLVWATKIKSTATDLGVPARPVRTPAMLTDRLADTDVAGLLLDLDQPDTAFELLAVARQAGPRFPVLCWGPHVEKDLFDDARRRGADEVMTRGALHANLPAVLTRLATPT